MKNKTVKKILRVVAPYLANIIIRSLKRSMRCTHVNTEKIRAMHEKDDRIILAFWHGRLLMMPYVYMGRNISVLISMHSDGELISRTMEFFGFSSVRGSTTRGGSSALRSMIKAVRGGHDAAITPDGPKGPRYVVQPGAIALAKILGAPICPATFSASKRKQFSSWDGFIIPYPFSKGVYIWGDPIYVDKDSGEDEMERKRIEVEESLRRITERADSFFD